MSDKSGTVVKLGPRRWIATSPDGVTCISSARWTLANWLARFARRLQAHAKADPSAPAPTMWDNLTDDQIVAHCRTED